MRDPNLNWIHRSGGDGRDLSPYQIRRAYPINASEFRSEEPWSDPSSPENDFWEYWIILRRHLRLILTLLVAAELVILSVMFAMTPLYTGESTILIEHQMPQVLENKSEQVDNDTEYGSFYKTQYEILKSRNLAARVIHTLQLDENPLLLARPSSADRLLARIASLVSATPPNRASDQQPSDLMGVKPATIDAYLKRLTVRPQYDTRLVTIAFTSPDPGFSAKIANAHVQSFIEQGYQRNARSGEAAQRFLEGKLVEIEKRIEKSEATLNDYRRERGIIAFSLDDKDQMIMDRMAGLNRALVQAEGERIGRQADFQAVGNKEYDSLPAVVNNTLIQNLKIESARLEGQYANLANQFTPDYPPAAQLHAQLEEVQRRQRKEIKRVVDSIESKYRAAVERENELRNDLEREKSRVLSLKDASLQDTILAREVDTNRALYQSVLERIKVLGVASEARVTNVSVIDSAEVPENPSSPKKLLSLVLAGFLALMIGVGASFVIDGSSRGLKSRDEVQRYLRLPSLATVLHVSGPHEKGLPPKDLCPMQWLPRQTEPERNSFAPASEAFRAVRTSILYSNMERQPKTVLFTSSSSGEGKSVTAANTAAAFAHLFDRVLLIDADLRRPRCHELLEQGEHAGLAEVLTGCKELEDVIHPTRLKGLFFLSAGIPPASLGELLGSKKMRDILASARSSFEQVLIDSAPILPVCDSVGLSTLVDGVVVVAGSHTEKQLVREACSRLAYVGAEILGIVLNDVDPDYQRYYAAYRYY